LEGKSKPCPYPEHPEKSAFFVIVETTWFFYHFQETKPVREISINRSKSGGQDPRNHQAVEIRFSLFDEKGAPTDPIDYGAPADQHSNRTN
jgi:hypothetical protein